MLIGIDGNEANVVRRVGIGEYALELLKQFENFQFPRFAARRAISNFQFRTYLKERPKKDLPKGRDGWEYRVTGPKVLWTQIGLPIDLFLHKPRPDVFFSPTHYAPRFSPVPTVISIMDLSYIHFPKMFKASDLWQLRSWTAYSVKKATRVLTISEASKNDIMREYNLDESRIVVTYPGIKMKTLNSKFEIRNKPKTQNPKLKTKYGIDGDYVLFVGTLQPRKNVVRLIEAFSLLRHPERSQVRLGKVKDLKDSSQVRLDQNDTRLIIVGKKGWLYEEILAAPRKFGVAQSVQFLDFVSNDELTLLYQNAVFFILPSLYEGFGLPILEAMANGCPVITSNVSSLPEAGGDAALYVDPTDVDDIALKMQQLLEDEKLRQELVAKGYEQVKKFSWEKTAKETLEVLEEMGRGA